MCFFLFFVGGGCAAVPLSRPPSPPTPLARCAEMLALNSKGVDFSSARGAQREVALNLKTKTPGAGRNQSSEKAGFHLAGMYQHVFLGSPKRGNQRSHKWETMCVFSLNSSARRSAGTGSEPLSVRVPGHTRGSAEKNGSYPSQGSTAIKSWPVAPVICQFLVDSMWVATTFFEARYPFGLPVSEGNQAPPEKKITSYGIFLLGRISP